MATVTLKGNPIETVGDLPAVGSDAPDFKLVNADLSEVNVLFYLIITESEIYRSEKLTIGMLEEHKNGTAEIIRMTDGKMLLVGPDRWVDTPLLEE